MTDPVTIELNEPPVPQARPRFNGRTGRVYPSKSSYNYGIYAKVRARSAMYGREPFDGPVKVNVLIELEPPKSWSKKKAEAALSQKRKPVSKPDLDNFLKLLLDSMNRIIYADDSQVCSIVAEKKYGPKSRAIVTVEPMGIEHAL